MYYLKIKKPGKYNYENVTLNNLLMVALHDELHFSRLKYKEDSSRWLNIAILPTEFIEDKFIISFYSESKEALVLFIDSLKNKYGISDLFKNLIISDIEKVENIKYYVRVNKKNVEMNEFSFSKVKAMIKYIIANYDYDHTKLKYIKTRRLICNEMNISKTDLNSFVITDAFIRKVQDTVSVKLDKDESRKQYFFKIDSSSTNTKDIVFKFRIDIIDKNDIAADHVNMVNSYGMSTKDYQFIIPID